MPPGEAPTNHFRIRELSIKNFRGISDLTINVTPSEDEGGLIVLAGDNGCGKTSVLEALLLVLSQSDLLPSDSASMEEQVRFGSSQFFVKATFDGPFPEPDPSIGDSNEKSWETDVTSNELLEIRKRRTVKPDANGMQDMGRFYSVDAVISDVEYYSARGEPQSLGAIPNPLGSVSSGEAGRVTELKRRLIGSYYRYLRERQSGPVRVDDLEPFQRLQRFLSKFLGKEAILDVLPISNNPGSGDEVVVRYGELPPSVTSLAMARKLSLTDSTIPAIVPVDRLSSGQLALFTFAGPLIFRDQPAEVVLIDEPERHMHPQWQRLLLGALRELSPSTQFVVATHSAFICQAAESGALFRLCRSPSKGIVARAVSEETYRRVTNGGIDDAIVSELFGLEHSWSDEAEEKRERLGVLRVKARRGAISGPEKKEMTALSKELDLGPSHDVEVALVELKEVLEADAKAPKRRSVKEKRQAGE